MLLLVGDLGRGWTLFRTSADMRRQEFHWMAFKAKETKSIRPATPEELYNELPRTQEAVKGLWVHQGDVLRAYAADYVEKPDVALELPTGTGKTLPGLLIAEWTRREANGQVVYACPTTQLAGQVMRIAGREGVPAVLLTGPSQDWSGPDQSAYAGGDAIAVTNYSSVFNSNPKLGQPRLLVLDDAHAGEQFVGERYGIDIGRRSLPESYQEVLSALAPFIDGLFLQRLRNENSDPGVYRQIRLITPGVKPEAVAALDLVLSRLPTPLNFQLAMIRSGIASCAVYLSYGSIQIRPMTPPTFENTVFTSAKQRLYLSATLGSGGELERAFGRPVITRLLLSNKVAPRSGRRLFVFPELAKGEDSEGLVARLVAMTNKAIVLTPGTTEEAKRKATALAPKGIPVIGKDDVQRGLDTFAKSPVGILGLANRYDGLDLPDDDCRMVILDGLPDSYSLQERFLSERVDAQAALAERVRTRVIQGAGRCTRGPNDFAVVVVVGSTLTNYLARPDIKSALDAELQAEVEFGWNNSLANTHDEIIENVQVFLNYDQPWRETGEPKLAEYRREAITTPPPGSDALQASVADEVEAWNLAYQGEWLEASARMQKAARLNGAGGDATRGFRSLLLYFAALWLNLGAQNQAQFAKSRELMRDAASATARGAWLREMTELPKLDPVTLSAEDEIAIATIVSILNNGVKVDRHAGLMDEMIANLNQTQAKAYGRGLTTLGESLGAQSFVPTVPGRCDSAWLWGSALWIALEAKTEQHQHKTVPLNDIRQTNSQLSLLASDQSMEFPPPGSVSVIVSVRGVVAPTDAMAANPNVYLTNPDDVLNLAEDVRMIWKELIPTASRQTEITLKPYIVNVLQQYGCLPSQVKERLAEVPIRRLP
jgi:hypothetical protein